MSRNEPAFPGLRKQVGENTYEVISQGGLTKREYFAAMAMQGLLISDPNAGKMAFERKSIAQLAVKEADALLAELAKETP